MELRKRLATMKCNSRDNHKDAGLAAAVLVNCTRRKSVRPRRESRAVSLPKSTQRGLETAWINRVNGLSPCAASEAFCILAAGFLLAQRTAQIAGAPLYVVSAGLGLVAADCVIPSLQYHDRPERG